MSSISPLTASSSPAPVASSGSTSSSATAQVPASIAANIALEAGVVATLGGATSADDGTSGLYTNLAGLASSAATPAGASSIDLNAQWASALKSNPALAPLAAHDASTLALVSAIL
jgi:hypothetical protein